LLFSDFMEFTSVQSAYTGTTTSKFLTVFACILAFTLQSSANAHEEPPRPSCIDRLRLAQSLESKEKTIELTKMLNEAFTPMLKSIYDKTRAMDAKTISKIIEKLPKTQYSYITNPRAMQISRGLFTLGFNGLFIGNGSIDLPKQDDEENDFNENYFYFTEFNKTAMGKLLRAVVVVKKITQSMDLHNDQMIEDNWDLLSEHTHSKTDMDETFHFAFLSVLQSTSALTGDPIGELTADQIVKEVMAQKGNKPSLVVMHSLLLKPGLLGRNGDHVYFKDPIEISSTGELTFSKNFMEFLKYHRAKFLQNDPRYSQDNEFGHGCPVGHRTCGDARPGLQYFLDAIMYIYNQLP
jgi:hypothetical protein